VCSLVDLNSACALTKRKKKHSLSQVAEFASVNGPEDTYVHGSPIGQGCVLHLLLSKEFSTQSLPPKAGLGFVHVRMRCWKPPPQDLEQDFHGDQLLQLPSEKNNNLSRLESFSYDCERK